MQTYPETMHSKRTTGGFPTGSVVFILQTSATPRTAQMLKGSFYHAHVCVSVDIGNMDNGFLQTYVKRWKS